MKAYRRHTRRGSIKLKLRNMTFKMAGIAFGVTWRLVPGLALKFARWLFFSPSRYRTRPLEDQYLQKADAFEIPLHQKKIKCWKWGHGPAILLAHGWNGRGIQLLAFIDPLVKAGYTVIAFDAPGHGNSPGKLSSYFEYADLIRTFLRVGPDLKIVGVIAHSLGASAVINGLFKERHPLDVVLIAPALKLYEILRFMFHALGFPIFVLDRLIGEFEMQFGYDMHAENPIRLLPNIQSKMLILHDEKDATISYSDTATAVQTLTNVTLKTTTGLGHKKILFDPSVVTLVVDYMTGRTRDSALAGGRLGFDEKLVEVPATVVAAYGVADVDGRLSLYLEYPQLRKRFIDMERYRD